MIVEDWVKNFKKRHKHMGAILSAQQWLGKDYEVVGIAIYSPDHGEAFLFKPKMHHRGVIGADIAMDVKYCAQEYYEQAIKAMHREGRKIRHAAVERREQEEKQNDN